MVNKVLVALSVVVVVSALGIGVLVGTQLTGDSDSTPITEPENDGEPGTATPTEGTETMTEQQTEIPSRLFSEAEIASNVTEFVNEERAERGLDPLSTDDTTADQLQAMAKDHSEAMASTGTTASEINNVSSADRYRNYGLYEQCKINRNGNYVIYPDDAAFEAVADTVAGQSYTVAGQEQFNEDERAVARAIVSQWTSYSIFDDRLGYEEATRIGVGASVGRDNAVYVTVNVCT